MNIVQGTFEPIPDRYCAGISELVTAMLQKNPDLRPDISQLLQHPLSQKYLEEARNGEARVNGRVGGVAQRSPMPHIHGPGVLLCPQT